MTKDEEQRLRELIGDSPREQYTFEGDDITFIKEQTVNVHSGANFYNSSQPKNKKINDVADEDPQQEPAPSPMLSTIDRINNGLKAVVEKKMIKSDYYYAAIVKFINEKDFFGTEINFADMENILLNSGLFTKEDCPKKGTIARISISGKFPNWKTDKGINVWLDLKNMIDVFYAAFKA